MLVPSLLALHLAGLPPAVLESLLLALVLLCRPSDGPRAGGSLALGW